MTAKRRTDRIERRTPSLLAGARLDRVVHELFGLTWSKARKHVEGGKIQLDGETASDCALPVPEDTLVRYVPDARRPSSPDRLDKDAIVFIDNHLVVVNKPSGMATVPFERGEVGTLDRRLRSYLSRRHPGPRKRRGARPALLVVHRLDKGTSGLLVFARTHLAKQHLDEQFRRHTVHRRYLALAQGTVTAQTIRSHLLKDRGDGLRGSSESSPHPAVRRAAKGRLAITHVEVVRRLNGASLIRCRLETGRTNQIRIHLAEAGHPLVGERIYQRGRGVAPIRAPRLMLHAAELGFEHPVSGQKLLFSLPLPAEMAELVDGLDN